MKEFQPPRAPSASSLPAAEPVMSNVAEPVMSNDPEYLRQNITLLESVLRMRRQNALSEQKILKRPPLQNPGLPPYSGKPTTEFPPFKKPRQIPKGNPPIVRLDPRILRMMRHEQEKAVRNAEALLQRAEQVRDRQLDLILQYKQSRGALDAEGDQQAPAASIGAAGEGEQKAAIGAAAEGHQGDQLGADQAQL